MPFMVIPLGPIIINTFDLSNETLPRQILYVQYEYLFDLETYYYPVLIHSYFGTCIFINVIVALDSLCMAYVQHAAALFNIIA